MEDRLITIAIHTFDHAHALKTLLENEGIEVTLQNVNLAHPVVAAGIRVRIHESDLPLALRIVENPDLFQSAHHTAPTGDQEMLVPVDFSDYSKKACSIAFHLAYAQKCRIKLFHSYIGNLASPNFQLSDSISFDAVDNQIKNEVINQEANALMNQFANELRKSMKTGSLPPVKFTTEIREGLAEEEIVDYAKENNPPLIIMGTRGAGKKERDLVGSVTAEVLDSCRFPVFTVPESCPYSQPSDIKEVVFFCNLDQEDILGIDALHRLLPQTMNITLANIPSKKQPSNIRDSIEALLLFCREHYPEYTFNSVSLTLESIVEDYRRLERSHHIDLISVPNKKKNIFARFFNPGIAHKLLFHADIPMLVIPV